MKRLSSQAHLVLGLFVCVAFSLPTRAAVFTNNTVINSFDTNFDGAEIVVSNCTLTVDGPHAFSNLLVTAGGTLTHTFGANGTVTAVRIFPDESHIFNGTNAVSLSNTGILAVATLTDVSKTTTYFTNQDYLFTFPGGNLIQVQRTTNSAIPDGGTVLVTYGIQVSTPSGLNLSVPGNAEVAAGGAINVNGKGFGGNLGTGNGGEAGSPTSGGGGGYGGNGGMSSGGAQGGGTYGSIAQPVDLGSGGGFGSAGGSGVGGPGGGLVKLVAGSLTVNGAISANGADATNSRSGGGSGGSIWITANSIAGAGSITANGGLGEPIHGGGGGAGRIALGYATKSFSGDIIAYGGNGNARGGAGTVYSTNFGQIATLTLDNGGIVGTNTRVQSITGANLIVRGSAIGATVGTVTLHDLSIASNSWVTGSSADVTLTVTGNATVDAGGGIQVDGRGFGGNGPGLSGAVGGGVIYGGGGGHGGYGGNGGTATARGGISTGSTGLPTTSGSPGGGSGSSFPPFGGTGGGIVRLIVNGVLTLNGLISAEGKPGVGTCGGGGAGGSIYLTPISLTGTGRISANGGAGVLPGGGGGGGGRIAVYLDTSAFAGSITAYGGSGTNYGGAGTIWIKTNSQVSSATVTLNNGGIRGTNTVFDGGIGVDVIITGRAIGQMSTPTTTMKSLVIRSNSVLQVPISTLLVNVTIGDLTIDAGGIISADGTAGSLGPGAGFTSSSGIRGGGGHGGYGGGNTGSFGSAYDSIQSPGQPGSSGGSGSGTIVSPLGGTGGGALHLNVTSSLAGPPPYGTGTLTVNGRLSANGNDGEVNSGGGSGGSLSISATTLAGSGVISANGGTGTGSAGGGGGGRVTVAYTANNFAGVISAAGGNGLIPGGAGTVFTKIIGANTGSLLINNYGLFGTNTPLSSTFIPPTVPFNLTINNGASVVPLTPLPLLSNLTVEAGGTLTILTNQLNLTVAVVKNVNVSPGGALTVAGKGFGRTTGPGAGVSLSSKGSGGGYGGVGGASASGAVGGTNYGSATQPVDRGSGGGLGANQYLGGSEGGSAIRMTVGGTLNVDGILSADGNAGLQDDSGGGSGGSIWITTRTLSGAGTISARGGAGDPFGGGGGGGGRIAIYLVTNILSGSMSVIGGNGAVPGQNGTLYSNSLAGFQVTSSTPTGVVSNTVSSVTLNFSDFVDPTSVSVSDFVLVGPNGTVPAVGFSSSVPTLTSARLTFPQQNLVGDYRIQAGPSLLDLFGQPLSQVYTGAFTIALPVISGTVTNASGQPVAGVTLQPNGGLVAAISDASGNYTLGVPTNWTGTVTPALNNLVFVPGARSYSNFTASVANENYLAVTTISPTLTVNLQNTNVLLSWPGIPGVTYQIYYSTNLYDWLPYGSAFLGSNGLISVLVPVAGDPTKFLRVNAGN